MTKADPTGDYIKNYVSELSKVNGKGKSKADTHLQLEYDLHVWCIEIHDPSQRTTEKYGYPISIVDHKQERERALRRYKNPGDE